MFVRTLSKFCPFLLPFPPAWQQCRWRRHRTVLVHTPRRACLLNRKLCNVRMRSVILNYLQNRRTCGKMNWLHTARLTFSTTVSSTNLVQNIFRSHKHFTKCAPEARRNATINGRESQMPAEMKDFPLFENPKTASGPTKPSSKLELRVLSPGRNLAGDAYH
jgi:hypothetical protein